MLPLPESSYNSPLSRLLIPGFLTHSESRRHDFLPQPALT